MDMATVQNGSSLKADLQVSDCYVEAGARVFFCGPSADDADPAAPIPVDQIVATKFRLYSAIADMSNFHIAPLHRAPQHHAWLIGTGLETAC
jgi:hypothetical protein